MTWPLLFGTAWLLVSAATAFVMAGAIRSAEGSAVAAAGRPDREAIDPARPAVGHTGGRPVRV